jgi:lipoprotein LprG
MPRTFKAALGAVALLVAACSGTADDVAGDWIAADVAVIVPASADAMGAVTSVRFELDRDGPAVFIDPVGSIALIHVAGRVTTPTAGDALVQVEVNDSLRTELGAVAVGGDVWLSNPVTGALEPLPPGWEFDPRRFFDPENGWEPMLDDLQNATYLGVEDNRYRVHGTVPAARIGVVTAGLLEDRAVEADLWIHPVTALVTRVEFDGWTLELSDYGEEFAIEPPT